MSLASGQGWLNHVSRGCAVGRDTVVWSSRVKLPISKDNSHSSARASRLLNRVRYAVELSLPALRSWPLRRFPHLVFYVEAKDCIDVGRVLQSARDIPAWMQGHLPE